MTAAMPALVIGQICLGTMGGSSRMACRLTNALSRRGHEVHIYSHHPLLWPLDAAVGERVCRTVQTRPATHPYRPWTESDQATFIRILADDIVSHQFDLLHYHYAVPFAGLMARVAARCGGRMPLVVGTLHGTDVTHSLRSRRALSALNHELRATDFVATVSHHMSRLSTVLDPTRPPPHVLPNFIEDEWPASPRIDGVGSDAPATILHVSNFRAVKDVGLLAEIYLAVHARTGAELCLVGDGPEMPRLRRFLDASPAAASVRYVGATAHPEGYFATATLLLSTSAEESFGLALLEGMAAGVPIAATAVGGVPELVEDGVTGLLFDATDATSAIERIVSLLESETRLAAFGRAGVRRAEAMRESQVIALYEDFYRQGLARRIEPGRQIRA